MHSHEQSGLTALQPRACLHACASPSMSLAADSFALFRLKPPCLHGTADMIPYQPVRLSAPASPPLHPPRLHHPRVLLRLTSLYRTVHLLLLSQCDYPPQPLPPFTLHACTIPGVY
eukprot:351644-Chlamydomonas_euryale.AAC.2